MTHKMTDQAHVPMGLGPPLSGGQTESEVGGCLSRREGRDPRDRIPKNFLKIPSPKNLTSKLESYQ